MTISRAAFLINYDKKEDIRGEYEVDL
jgi:hypothetical protein